jgi:hypothetical protein
MKVFRTLIMLADTGELLACDTIEHEGKLWLVPEWNAGPIQGTERPARIICLHGLPTQRASPHRQDKVDMELLIPLSKATLAGGTAQGLDVREAPDVIRYAGTDTKLH